MRKPNPIYSWEPASALQPASSTDCGLVAPVYHECEAWRWQEKCCAVQHHLDSKRAVQHRSRATHSRAHSTATHCVLPSFYQRLRTEPQGVEPKCLRNGTCQCVCVWYVCIITWMGSLRIRCQKKSWGIGTHIYFEDWGTKTGE